MTRQQSMAMAGLFLTAWLVAPASLVAQGHADFSGKWTLDAAVTAPVGRGGGNAAAAGTMGSGWGSEITLTQTPTRLTIEYAFFGRGDMQAPLKFVYALDGTETRDSVMMGRGFDVSHSVTGWDRASLVIVTKQFSPNPLGSGPPLETQVARRLTLESPTSLVIETTRGASMGGASSTTRTIYKKP